MVQRPVPVTPSPGWEELQREVETALERSYVLMRDGGTGSTRRAHGGARSKTPRVRKTEPERQREQTSRPDRMVASTPGPTEQVGEDEQTSPEIPVVENRPIVERQSQDDTVREVVDSYMETLAKGTVGRYRLPPVTPPKYKVGGNWRCFLEEFKEMDDIIGGMLAKAQDNKAENQKFTEMR